MEQPRQELQMVPAADPVVASQQVANELRYLTHIRRNIRGARALLRSRPLAPPARSR